MNQPPSILIVDDEEDIRRLLATALRRSGLNAATADSGNEALDMLQHASYEVVVTDIKMPGMDGLELLRRIAERNPLTKGLVITGYGSIQGAVEATKLGADNYVTKPIIIEEFVRVVRKTLESGQPLRAGTPPALEVSALAALTGLLAQPSLGLQQVAQGSVQVVSSMFSGSASVVVVDANSGQEIVNALGGRHADQLPDAAELSVDVASHLLTAPLGSSPSGSFGGSLVVSRPADAQPFSEQEAQLLQVAANQVSIALGNVLAGRSLAMTLRELREHSLQTVRALVRAVEMRDHYTAGHSARVSRYAVALANSLGLDRPEIDNLRIAALLHDVGKIGISDLLLNKPGPLTAAERAQIEEHPVMGCQIVQGVQTLAASVPLILHHQERYDGLGYPSHLAGEQIPLGARILAVADSFEAMTATRAYRRGRSTPEALEILAAGAGQQWDAALVARWVQIADRVVTSPDPAAPADDP